MVVKKHSNVKFLIVGDGDQKVSLVNLASSLKVSQYIIFLGFLINDKLPKYLASADINVSTSTSDAGLAASTAEAMSSGIPVIITEFGDKSTWVKDTTNGLTFPIGDFQFLAEKICLLIENDGLRKIFGSRGREIIDMNNNYYKEMEKVNLIYQSVWQGSEK